MKKIILMILVLLLVGCGGNEPVVENETETVVASLNETTQEEETTEEVVEVSMDGYEFAGTMNDKTKVYYKPMEDYYKLKRASEIATLKDGVVTIVMTGELSIPEVSPDKMQYAFVEGVGFERKGTLKLFKDGKLEDFVSEEIAGLDDKSRTIKSCTWLDSTHMLSLIGYDTGTISQGGDVYLVNLESGDIRLIVDSKEGYEIAGVGYNEDTLSYTVVAWENGNYSVYNYFEEEIIYSEASFPIKVDWQPNNLEAKMLESIEVLELPEFNANTTIADMSGLEMTQAGENTIYNDLLVTYEFKPVDENVWRIISDQSIKLPRGIKLGDTLSDVLSHFPQATNYKKTDNGLFYGELSSDAIKQSYAATLTASQTGKVMSFYTENKYPNLKLYFEDDLLVSVEVKFYD